MGHRHPVIEKYFAGPQSNTSIFKSNDLLMEGIIIVFARDFQQALLAIPKGTMADKIDAHLKLSLL